MRVHTKQAQGKKGGAREPATGGNSIARLRGKWNLIEDELTPMSVEDEDSSKCTPNMVGANTRNSVLTHLRRWNLIGERAKRSPWN